jgi:hypothetical protein
LELKTLFTESRSEVFPNILGEISPQNANRIPILRKYTNQTNRD